jgi:hypothetical protein
MGARPGPDWTIERLRSSGDYEPSNCHWATQRQQVRNRSNTRTVVISGKSLPLAQAAEEAGISYRVVLARIDRYGMSIEQALSTPIRNPKLEQRR